METEDKQTIEPAFGELHRAFLEEWPVERVALMTLDEYSNREFLRSRPYENVGVQTI